MPPIGERCHLTPKKALSNVLSSSITTGLSVAAPRSSSEANSRRSAYFREEHDMLRDQLRRDLGADASEIDFLPFSDLEASVRDDVQRIRTSPLIPDDIPVRGFVYDVRTGRLTEVH